MICARAGFLERPLNVSSMCHIVRDTEWGAEMRSVFWLGHIGAREGNRTVFSIEGLLGNTALVRYLALDTQLAVDLMTHAIEGDGLSRRFPATSSTRLKILWSPTQSMNHRLPQKRIEPRSP